MTTETQQRIAAEAPATDDKHCGLCEAGFPLDDNGNHIPTQKLGMIPVTRCRKLPPATDDKPPSQYNCGYAAYESKAAPRGEPWTVSDGILRCGREVIETKLSEATAIRIAAFHNSMPPYAVSALQDILSESGAPRGEQWTPQFVADLISQGRTNPIKGKTGYHLVVDAHNAALAAERYERLCERKNAARELSAERQRSKELIEDLEHYSDVIDKREQQLLSAQAAIEELAQLIIELDGGKLSFDHAKVLHQIRNTVDLSAIKEKK